MLQSLRHSKQALRPSLLCPEKLPQLWVIEHDGALTEVT
jgi:hypothetical protein